MKEVEVTYAWIQKQQNKDKYTLWTYDETAQRNACLCFTMKQLKILKEDIEKRIKKYSTPECE